MIKTGLLLLATGVVAGAGYSATHINTYKQVDVHTELQSIKNGSDALRSLIAIQQNLGSKTSSDELLTYLVDRLRNETISQEVYCRMERLVSESDFIGPESFSLVVFYSACQRASVESPDHVDASQRAIVEILDLGGDGRGEL